jgi:hypothetical protein
MRDRQRSTFLFGLAGRGVEMINYRRLGINEVTLKGVFQPEKTGSNAQIDQQFRHFLSRMKSLGKRHNSKTLKRNRSQGEMLK